MTLIVSSGQTVSAVELRGTEEMIVQNGGTAIATMITQSAFILVSHGGVVSNTNVDRGSTVIYGEAIDSFVSQGGSEDLVHGLSIGTTVEGPRSDQDLQSRSVASGTVLSAGVQTVSDSLAVGSVVLSAGYQGVMSGGVASATVISRGGQEVLSGGRSRQTILRFGGREVADQGGMANHTTISNGGTLVLSGGTAADVYLRVGGTLDLAQMTFVSGGTVTSSGGMLTVSEGGNTSSVSLQGHYAHDIFYISDDLGGGTAVTLSLDVNSATVGSPSVGSFAASDTLAATVLCDLAHQPLPIALEDHQPRRAESNSAPPFLSHQR